MKWVIRRKISDGMTPDSIIEIDCYISKIKIPLPSFPLSSRKTTATDGPACHPYRLMKCNGPVVASYISRWPRKGCDGCGSGTHQPAVAPTALSLYPTDQGWPGPALGHQKKSQPAPKWAASPFPQALDFLRKRRSTVPAVRKQQDPNSTISSDVWMVKSIGKALRIPAPKTGKRVETAVSPDVQFRAVASDDPNLAPLREKSAL